MNYSDSATEKWYEKYLPFVAKSPKIQLKWLATQLARLNSSDAKRNDGIFSREEIKPYIRLFLENSNAGQGYAETGEDGRMMVLLNSLSEANLLLMMECVDIYDIPKLLSLVPRPTLKMAIIALQKTPPPYEKNPLLAIDRVFLAIKEKSGKLLEESAAAVITNGAPTNFADNFGRFQEIMLDEHILSLLYPKAR